MRVLGLDPSLTNFGWAIHDTDADGKLRCESRGRFQTGSSDVYVDRYVTMRERLRHLIRDAKPDRMGIEFPVFDNLFSEGMYGLFLYCSEAIKDECQDVVFWSPLQVKAHAREFLGLPSTWRMDKPDMVKAAKQDTGFVGRWNHNEADAYLVAKLAARFWLRHDGLLTDQELTKVESKYFAAVHTYVRGKRAGETVHRGVLFREDERFFRWSKSNREVENGESSSEVSFNNIKPFDEGAGSVQEDSED